MRSLIVRSPWYVVRSAMILGAIVTGWLVMMNSGLGQQAPATTQDNKPAAPSEKKPASDSSSRPAPNMAEMMQKMNGQARGGKFGGMMGQPANPAQATEPTLEEMLNKALKDNPDIRVAEAKVREADAELNRTRLQVTQKVLAFHYSRESQKAVIKFAEENMVRIRKLKETNAISTDDAKVAEQQLSAAKAKLAEIEADMPYLLGQQHGNLVSSVTVSLDGKSVVLPATIGAVKNVEIPGLFHSIQPFEMRVVKTGPVHEGGTVTEKLLKALDTPMTVDYQDKPITEIFKEMEKIVPGLSIQGQIPAPDEDDLRRLTLKGQFSMRAVLELMEDTFSVRMNPEPQTRYTFAVREYGLLFAPNDRIPREAIRLHDLQKEIPPPKEEKKQDMQRK